MRILQVCHRFVPSRGGVEVHVSKVARELVKMGHDVDVLTTTSLAGCKDSIGLTLYDPSPSVSFSYDTHGLPFISQSEGYRVIRCPNYLQIFSYMITPKMLTFLLTYAKNYDVVHCHTFRFTSVDFTAFASWLRKFPAVMTAHSPIFLDYYGKFGRLLDTLYHKTVVPSIFRQMRYVIALTPDNKLEYIRAGVPEWKIRVIPNGVDFDEFQSIGQRHIALRKLLENFENIILYIGRFTQQKCPDRLIQAMPYILKDFPKTHLLMVGKDTGMLTYCKTLASRLRVSRYVTFIEDADWETVKASYSIADFCVFPSFYEGFNLTALEAQACGKPIVATYAGGLKHIVKHNYNGIHIHSSNASDIARACMFLLGDPMLRKRLGENARDFARKHSWKAVAEKLVKVYCEAKESC